MSEIPTAKDYLKRMLKLGMSSSEIMTGFTKRHVEACKEEYLQKGFGRYMNHAFDKNPTRVPIDEDSILNAYPLTNIK